MSDAVAGAARAARAELERLIDTDAPALGDGLPPGFADAAERYVALLLDTNARMNLTRVTAPADVARLHLLDALAALGADLVARVPAHLPRPEAAATLAAGAAGLASA